MAIREHMRIQASGRTVNVPIVDLEDPAPVPGQLRMQGATGKGKLALCRTDDNRRSPLGFARSEGEALAIAQDPRTEIQHDIEREFDRSSSFTGDGSHTRTFALGTTTFNQTKRVEASVYLVAWAHCTTFTFLSPFESYSARCWITVNGKRSNELSVSNGENHQVATGSNVIPEAANSGMLTVNIPPGNYTVYFSLRLAANSENHDLEVHSLENPGNGATTVHWWKETAIKGA